MEISKLEEQNDALTAENERLNHQIEAFWQLLAVFQTSMNENQRNQLVALYQQTRAQHLNNLALDEAQGETLEALLDLLEDVLN